MTICDGNESCTCLKSPKSIIEQLQAIFTKKMEQGELSSYVFAAISDGETISAGAVCVRDHIKMIGLLEDNKARVMESRLKEHK